ncbi:MAG: hypothetical protein GX963_03820 [Bacteroidales bacterium]|nr:hypothetical protein [Bacteroidales bacterium]
MIVEAIHEIDNNTKLFYQQKDKEGYTNLENTLALLIQTTNVILENNLDNIDGQVLNTILINAMDAIKIGDTILLSDILYFDLKPLLERAAM